MLLAITRHLPTWKGFGRLPIWLRQWYLRRPRPPVEVNVGGVLLRLSPGQFVDGWLLFGPQFYEARELRALMALLRSGDVFVDVGAHVGLYALQAAQKVGERGMVIAIEPNPTSARELRHNVQLNALRNVRVVEAAAAGSGGVRVLAEPSDTNRAGATLLGGPHQPIDVAAKPLLEILRMHGAPRIDVVKLDIEGAEHEVLARFFDDSPPEMWPQVIMTEHYPQFAARGGDVLALLRAVGYRQRSRYGANYLFTIGRVP